MADKWKDAKNILCIRLDNMGDILMTSPAIRAIKETYGSKITLLTSQSGSDIAKFIPEIDEVIIANVPWRRHDDTLSPKSLNKLIERLKSKKFDGAVIFTNYSQTAFGSAMLTYLSNIPLRLAYIRENPYELLTNWVPDTEPFTELKHGVVRQLELVSTIGATTDNDYLKVHISESASLQVENKLAKKGISLDKPFLILHPGVSEKKRQFSPDIFADAAKRIINETGYQVIVTGVKREQKLADSLVRKIGKKAISLAGQLSLEEFIALVGLSDLLIGNNSGPIHIAAAVQTPVVVLYARTNMEHTPWKVKNKVLYFDTPEEMKSKNTILQATKLKDVIPNPTAEDIVIAVKELLADSAKTPTITKRILSANEAKVKKNHKPRKEEVIIFKQ